MYFRYTLSNIIIPVSQVKFQYVVDNRWVVSREKASCILWPTHPSRPAVSSHTASPLTTMHASEAQYAAENMWQGVINNLQYNCFNTAKKIPVIQSSKWVNVEPFSKPLTVYVEDNRPQCYDLVQKAGMPLSDTAPAVKFQNSCNVIQRETW